ncbi:thioesterase II family protein [Streptomyces sp. NPDC058256]|uniref:thioesterase II family protein n=1 Tax=Streptomyces sp. NPDC058256 TaxID=3346408 RepID=UPI0036EA1D41
MNRPRDPWIRPAAKGESEASVRLFCLPYAGGGATVFRDWLRDRDLGRRVEVLAVQLPGRGNRIAEPAFDDARLLAKELTGVLAPYLDRPYGIYGHSMGGLAGLALARELARSPGLRQPAALFVGASVAPGSVRPQAVWRGSDAELTEWLRRTGGTPASVLAKPALLELLLPALRADLALVAGYRRQPSEELAVPIRGFAGASDLLTPSGAMRGWAAETAVGFTLSQVPGGHFFLAESSRAVLEAITGQLLAADGPGRVR